MGRDFRYDTESDPNMRTSSPVSEMVDRLERRASTMNGALVGASDGHTYTLGYYDQLAAKDDKEAASTLTTLYTRNAELEREVKRLREALEPFAEIAGEAWADGSGWTNAACQNDRICDWFGPSAFHAARRVREGGKIGG